MRPAGRLVALLAGLALVPGVASAHGTATDAFEAPVPLDLVLIGAALTVGLTALWLFVHGEIPTTPGGGRIEAVSPRTASIVRGLARGAFFALFVGVLFAGLFGRQVRAENPATLFVWPVWLKGLGLLAIAAGSPWRVLSPWRTIYDAIARLEGRAIALLGDYPERLGTWPAVLGFVLVVGVVENLTTIPESPRRTAILVAVGTLVMVLGGLCFGRAWFRNADPLHVLYGLLGRVAPIDVDRREDGGYDVGVRSPWRGCVPRSGAPSTAEGGGPQIDGDAAGTAGLALVAFVVGMVYTVSFDGFTETRRFQAILFDARELLGTGSDTSVLLYLLGLAAFLLAYLAATRLVARLGGASGVDRTGRDWLDVAVAFAPTLVPIAAAYEVAHTYPFVVRNADRLLVELLGAAGVHVHPIEPLAGLPLGVFWGSQVALIVLGHVVAVVAAHAVALDRFGSDVEARRGHLPLVVVMVGYTVLSLWIVSRPVV